MSHGSHDSRPNPGVPPAEPAVGEWVRGSDESLELLVALVVDAMRMLREARKPVNAEAFAEQIAAYLHRIEAANRRPVPMPHLDDDQQAHDAVRHL